MPSVQDDPPLIGIVDLFSSLNAEGVRYCHWKSNCHLDRSVRGRTDLDLLVDPAQGQQFRLILDQHGLKPVKPPAALQYPAIEDYLGFDAATGRLFHLHVHYQLILGEQYVKNYRLPLESVFLEKVQLYEQLVKIPAPELELIVLAIRLLFKYRDRDAVKDALSIRSPGIAPAMLREFEYLLGQADHARVAGALAAHVGFVSPEIVLGLIKTVSDAPRSGWTIYRLRNRLRRELSACQRYSRWQAICRYWGLHLWERLPFLERGRTRKTPATGGRIVAVIGADGAGKSTLVGELHKWLSWKLKTHVLYMGSQQPSAATRLALLGYRAARKANRLWAGFTGPMQLCLNLVHLSVGRDRCRRYTTAKRLAGQGAIVLCDRYPLDAIWRVMDGLPMDGPRIAVEAGPQMGRLARRLSEIEQALYRKIAPPDHIVALHVSPQVSLQRKPDHDPDMIFAKSRALKQMDRAGLQVIDIDADLPAEQVLLQVKTALWKLL